MVNKRKQAIGLIAALGVWGCMAAGEACAGDTLARLIQAQAQRGNGNSRIAPTRPPTGHLDLAPPTGAPQGEDSRVNTESFRAAARHTAMGAQRELPAAFSAVSNEGRPQSKAEQLARNFHRDGLPVAKLFQSNDALVHIGLSPKGKPGLWLIKKLH